MAFVSDVINKFNKQRVAINTHMLTNFRNLATHEGAQSYTRMHFNLSAQNRKFLINSF